ncbi:MAG: hypothetical protein C5B48_09190, partial [Candidatus Rokuibacteriota bacterium]
MKASASVTLGIFIWLGIMEVPFADAGSTTRASVDSAGNQFNRPSQHAAISANGRFVAFESLITTLTGDIRGIFVHDLRTGTTVVASQDLTGTHLANGDSFNPAISANGRFVAFESDATNLVAGDTNA